MSSQVNKLSLQLFRAPWVVPISSPVIIDGAVVLDQNSIVAVGSFADIICSFPQLPVRDCSGVLLPPLVNAHIHLDLSAYGTVYPASQASTMCEWIALLLQKRQQENCSQEELQDAAHTIVQDQYDSGVGLILDIGNINLRAFDECSTEVVSLIEMLGPSKNAQLTAISAIDELPPGQPVTGHAPYSTTPGLLQFIKTRSEHQDSLFSIHLAENPDEALLLHDGKGCFADFLRERGGWDSTFPLPGIDRDGVVGYLHRLGILNDKTICVHCVHLTTEEIGIIARSQAHVCLCPGSNKFLSVGTAPVGEFLKHKMLPALGTDSIASNPRLDMWHEMSLLREICPTIDPEQVLKIATLGGARAMHRSQDYGSLEQGRKPQVLHVQGTQYESVGNADRLLDRLTSCGRPESITWLRPDN